jgi:DNA topoisomerase-1
VGETSWHLEEYANANRSRRRRFARRVGNAITRLPSPGDENPRQVDVPLVEAYRGRALDLVGFKLSPVLWPPSRCKIRRPRAIGVPCIIVEREMEIEAFNNREYWSVKAQLSTPRNQAVETTDRSGWQKLDKFDLENATQAELAEQAVKSRDHRDKRVEAKP